MRPSRFYAACRALVRFYFAVFLPLLAKGVENIPPDGAVILCGNHISMLDPLAIAVIARRPIHFMAKKELFAFKPLGALLRSLNAFPVNRKNTDMSAMRTSISILKDGRVLGIFPEGARRKDEAHPELETGVGLIALRSKAALVPVRIIGPYRLFRKTGVVFGPPVDFREFWAHVDGNALAEAMERIEKAIFSLSI